MEKINITIPDNLTPEQELTAISKKLGRKLLPTDNKKLLGTGYEIKHLETQITIKREQVKKPIVTRTCLICKTIFEHKIGKRLWINYGGAQKQHHYCRNECREAVLQVEGTGRASIKKSELGLLRTWTTELTDVECNAFLLKIIS